MPGQAVIEIRDKQWAVGVATTPAELSQGLSGSPSMPADTGMLFDLEYERSVTVNAYNMLFPLSIVFISEQLVVTEVVPILAVGDDVTASLLCRFFLETNVGEVGGIEPGDQVVITGYTPATPVSLIELLVTVLVVAMVAQMMIKVAKEV